MLPLCSNRFWSESFILVGVQMKENKLNSVHLPYRRGTWKWRQKDKRARWMRRTSETLNLFRGIASRPLVVLCYVCSQKCINGVSQLICTEMRTEWMYDVCRKKWRRVLSRRSHRGIIRVQFSENIKSVRIALYRQFNTYFTSIVGNESKSKLKKNSKWDFRLNQVECEEFQQCNLKCKVMEDGWINQSIPFINDYSVTLLINYPKNFHDTRD